ncbi:MAG: glycosyltransferase family 2 protein [Bacteroidaceae bacterium]|nr:glycosyltransferase family 2 protein [Bacteroidaceae bacterium]
MISIIVPVFNVAAYLPKCLDSLINQTYQDLEIICVNDGSTDKSLDILQSYSEKDKRIKVISRENKGISATRNEALEVAMGEYIMFVDSDDWINVQTCEKALYSIEEHRCDLVLWSYIREFKGKSLPNYLYDQTKVWENGKSLCRRIVGPIDEELRTPQKLDSYGTVWGKLYKRELVERDIPIRFVDTKKIGTCEDILFNVEYSLRTNKTVYIPVLLYHYRKLNSSFTSKYRESLSEQWKELYKEMKNVLIQNNVFEDCRRAYNNRISLGMVGLGLNITFSSYSFSKQQTMIKKILDSNHYKKAICSLSLNFFPIHWKFFYFCAQKGYANMVFALLKLINRIIS